MCVVVVVAAVVVSARAAEIICSKTHSIESRLVTGPKNSICRRAFALFSALYLFGIF